MKLNPLQLSREIVSELKAFAQILGADPEIPKPTKRFLEESLYGMLKAQSVVASQIAQELPGSQPVLHRLQRLSYQLTNSRWDPLSCASSYLQWAAQELDKDTVICADIGDIAKKYAKHMPGLCPVWDGSDKTVKHAGYFLAEIEAVRADGRHVPLYLDPLSSRKASYVSQNHQMDLAIDFVISHIGIEGIWVMDRGFDDMKRFKFLNQRNLSWVIRINGTRHAQKAGFPYLKTQAISELAMRMKPSLILNLRSNGKSLMVRAASLKVELKDQRDSEYSLVVVWTKRKNPWYLLTNLSANSSEQIQRIVRAYATRWGVEDAARVIKQCFDLENIRLLTFQGIRKMVWLALWAYAFLCRIGLWPKKFLHVILSALSALWPWRDLKIIHYRLSDFIARALVWPPPDCTPHPASPRRVACGDLSPHPSAGSGRAGRG
jgi:hypothetical protein